MGPELWAASAALALYLAATWPDAWESLAGGVAGWALGIPAVTMGAMLAGMAVGLWRRAEAGQKRKDQQDAEAEAILLQLLHEISAGAPLAAALDHSLPGGSRAYGQDTETAVAAMVAAWPVPALRRASGAFTAASRHGGELPLLIRAVLDQLRQDRRLRWERQSAMAGPRTTLLVVSLAPWPLLLVFRGILPTFYTALTASWLGQACLVWCGLSAVGLEWAAQGGMHTDG
jgi:tight adherence protein B